PVEAAWAAGRAASLDKAIEFALQEPVPHAPQMAGIEQTKATAPELKLTRRGASALRLVNFSSGAVAFVCSMPAICGAWGTGSCSANSIALSSEAARPAAQAAST